MAETIEFRGDEHIDLAASRVWRYASEVRTRVALHLYGVRE